jgi:hypothetical protein
MARWSDQRSSRTAMRWRTPPMRTARRTPWRRSTWLMAARKSAAEVISVVPTISMMMHCLPCSVFLYKDDFGTMHQSGCARPEKIDTSSSTTTPERVRLSVAIGSLIC